MPRKILFHAPLFLLTCTFVFASAHYSIYPSDQDQPPSDTVSVIGVGDIMMGSNYPDNTGLPPDDGKYLFEEVKDLLGSADATMGNLEGVLLDSGGIAKTCRNPKVCYVFRSPERYVQNLISAGFDVMSVANNHAGDFGDPGARSTIRALDGAGLHHAGQLIRPYTTFERNGIQFGFVAFAPNGGCVSILDLQGARKIVQHLDSICDVVIASFHGGAEGPLYQHVTRNYELFYGENRGNVYQLAHTLIDAGADVVYGHGPHVVRAVEVYKDRFIAYSLGNFCTYGGINVAGINGLAPIIKVFMNKQGVFLQAKITSGIQHFLDPVRIDEQKQAIGKIQELTQQDFPESEIEIDSDGWIRKSTK